MSTLFVSTLVNGLFLAAAYALAALGLALVFGVLGILNFAHGVLLLFGAYIAVSVTSTGGLPLLAGVIIAGTVVAMLGAGMEITLFRRVENKPISGLIISVGLIGIAGSLFQWHWGTNSYYLPRLVSGGSRIGSAVVGTDRLIDIGIAAVLLAIFQFGLSKAGWGKVLRAVAEDPDAATLQGISVRRIRSVTFAAGAGLAAIAGVLLGSAYEVQSSLAETMLIQAFVVIIVGGTGNTVGTILGALIVGLASSFGVSYLPLIYSQLLPLLLLVAILLVRPQGILGRESARV